MNTDDDDEVVVVVQMGRRWRRRFTCILSKENEDISITLSMEYFPTGPYLFKFILKTFPSEL